MNVRHSENTVLLSVDEEVQPSEHLLFTALKCAGLAPFVGLGEVSDRIKDGPIYPNIWPGEHYRLLAAVVTALKPKMIIEIGTGGGLSALSMKKYLSPSAKIVTFDLVGWREHCDSVLKEEDFTDRRLVQHIDNLVDPEAFSKYIEEIRAADIIFVDGPKDGTTEEKIWNNILKVDFINKPLIIFDDIRLLNMVWFWRSISLPKLDMTSFGHWTGTGFVEIK